MKNVLVALLFCALAIACEPLTVEDIAGDWTVEEWPLSDTTQDVGTVSVRINAAQDAGLFFDVPDNDWGYGEGDVVFSGFEEETFYHKASTPRHGITAFCRLRYLEDIQPGEATTVWIQEEGERELGVYYYLGGKGALIMMLRR